MLQAFRWESALSGLSSPASQYIQRYSKRINELLLVAPELRFALTCDAASGYNASVAAALGETPIIVS